jgi:hypothetical protein
MVKAFPYGRPLDLNYRLIAGIFLQAGIKIDFNAHFPDIL